MRVSAPRGTSGDISVPVTSANAEVTVNGRVVWNAAGSQALGTVLSDGYVTLHNVRGGTPFSVDVRTGP
jgi:hypothetical protein